MPNDRTATNPVLSGRKLKLGTFQTNLESGCCMSDIDGRLRISWPSTIALAKLAEDMDFEAIVPVARWRGFGGITNPQGPGFEAYTWAAGIAASTAKAGVVSTSHVSLNHPLMAAKQSAAIDHISNGRFMLNVVCGWNGPEMDMFGIPLTNHADRYAAAQEWIDIVKRLWTEDEEFDFDGPLLSDQERLFEPKPLQDRPPIMNAGPSSSACNFAVKNCDIVFHAHPHPRLRGQQGPRRRLPQTRARGIRPRGQGVDACLRRRRRDREGSRGVLRLLRPPERRLGSRRERHRHHVRGDQPEGHAARTPQGDVRDVHRGLGRAPPVGSREQIVDKLAGLSRMGMDGVLLSWPRFEDGMRAFRDKTLPLIKQAG